MWHSGSSVLDTLRQPEHTGTNRCVPCTVVNVIIAVLIAGGIAIATSLSLATLALGICLGAIYFRGYLVPGTPTLTKRYFPERLLSLFDKPPEPPQHADIDVESILRAADALTDCDTGDDVCLTDSFATAWHDRITALQSSNTARTELAMILGLDQEALSFRDLGEAFVATRNGARIGQWESHAAFIADIAAAQELRDRYPAWWDLTVAQQSKLLSGLRIFLEQCPSCGGPISIGQEVVESCCRSIDVVAVTCNNCEARLFEAEHPAG